MNLVDGAAFTFYPNGQQRSQHIYRDGKPHGAYKVWRPDGSLAHENWFDAGLPNGLQKQYYQNGNVKSITRFFSGRVASHIEYDERGLKVIDRR